MNLEAQAASQSSGGMFTSFTLSGHGHELGRRHGILVAEQARSFLSDNLLRLNALRARPTSLRDLRDTVHAHYEMIARCLPGMAAEIDGFAEGAEISREEAVLMQIRREILGYSAVPVRGDCTTFARVDTQDAVLAQTVDLNGDLEREGYVLRVVDTGTDGRQLVMLNFTGLSGYLGMNSHGLAIGINLVLAGSWRPGVPAYMALRYLLEHATCVRECVALLEKLPLASSRSFMLCDRESAAYVEMANGEFAWKWGERLAHTNHFLEKRFLRHDQLNLFARNGSARRLVACKSALALLRGRTPREAYWDVLDREPICVGGSGDIRREVTVARVVMQPREFRFAIKHGARSDAVEQTFSTRRPS